MKRTLHISAMVVAAVMAAGCNPADELDNRFADESAAAFLPVLSSNAVSVETKASELVSEDGSISIPLSCTVSEGIFGNQVLTKGAQKNTTGEVDALENYVTEFYVAGWKGTGAFIPAYQRVVKRDGVFQTATEYSWPSAAEATFYGYANLPLSGVSVSSTANSQTLTYTAVPDDAGDQNDILLGFFRGKGRFDETLLRGGIADMTFCHPLTAVRFKMGTFSGATSVTVKSITMEGVYDSGEAIMQPASATATTAPVTWDCSGSGTKTVTLDNGDTGWTVAAGAAIGDPFILIPQDFTSNAVKIKVIASLDGGSDVTLTAALEAVWEAGKTHTYTLGYDSRSFILTGPKDYDFVGAAASSDNSQSIDCYFKDAAGGTQTAGDYRLEYSTDGGTTYSTASPAWVSVSVGDGTKGAGRAMTVSVTEITDFTTVSASQALQMMPEKTGFDLSKFNPATGMACAASTANTYVINSAGTYTFPVVYGNALKNGSYNTSAYKPGTASNPSMNPSGQSGYYYSLNSFLDYQDQPVSSPYILEGKTGTYTAGVLWSDVNNLVTDVALNGTGKDAYISFKVDKNYINEGNAVIYLADPSGAIVWSWQIWVNAFDISQTVSLRNNGGQTHDLMAINLGWEAVSTATMDMPSPRSVKIRIVMSCDGEDKEQKVFCVSQSAPGKYTQATDGRNTFYQWGRKDPIVPGGCRNVYNVKSGASPVETITYQSKTFVSARVKYASSSTEAGVTIGQTIKAPYIHYCSYWQAPTKYDIVNLWNGAATGRDYTGETQKTIYDPSPVGFAVPSANVFTGLISSGTEATTRAAINAVGDFDPTSATGTGWTFYTGGWQTGSTLSFALSGNRDSHQSHWSNRLDADVVSDTPQDEGRLWTSASTRVSGNSNVLATGLVYHPTWVKPKHTFDEADATSIRAVKEAE